MMLSWITYALVIGALLALAAAALDRVARAHGWPARFLWAGVIATSVLWPIATALRALRPTLASPIIPFSVTLPDVHVVGGASAPGFAAVVERSIAIAWVLASALLLGRLVADIAILRRLRRRWPVREIDGLSARLTTDIGPAVIGLRSMELVIPEWVLSFDESLRALVLRHEEEHRAARDPYLLIGARLAIAVLPWNLALWYAARRLRLAIELDCDARVLRAHPSPRRYGMLLLAIAQRRTTAPTALAPMLSEPTSHLERRILAMRSGQFRSARLTTLIAALAAAGVVALACSVQPDTPTSSPASKAPTASPANKTSAYFEFKLSKEAKLLPGAPAPRYPDALRRANVEGSVIAQFVVNPDGSPDVRSFKVVKSTDPQFIAAVKDALPSLRFSPAEVKGHKVRQLITMPFMFSLNK
jgi:bla regulator protein blaR1